MPDFFLINGHKVRVIGFCAQDLGKKYRILPANTDDDAVIEIDKEEGMFIHDSNLFQVIL